ncbi:hypothetical protein [Serratia ficaria]|uniref:hypothetical protein n=1 Tax=Serratia ficaria TaxID=61651 RepID=UPI0021B7C36E|nr:hypothetical protein [Serratia ficaria]
MKKTYVAIIPLIMFISGCSVSLNKSPEDYTGSDFARIRVKNYLPPLTMEIYKKDGECYKLSDTRSLGPGVNFIGIKSTNNKKISGMFPPSKDLQGMDALEYKIQANQRINITYRAETFRSQYNQTISTFSRQFVPEAGHDYDIWVGDYGAIQISDLTKSESAPDNWHGDKECKAKRSFWTGNTVYE